MQILRTWWPNSWEKGRKLGIPITNNYTAIFPAFTIQGTRKRKKNNKNKRLIQDCSDEEEEEEKTAPHSKPQYESMKEMDNEVDENNNDSKCQTLLFEVYIAFFEKNNSRNQKRIRCLSYKYRSLCHEEQKHKNFTSIILR